MTAPETFRAVRVARATDPAALEVGQVVRPEVGPGEVLVEVRAAAVNRSDVLSVRGLMPMTTFPRVPGRDFAGVVAAGPGQLLGRRVWGVGGADLGFIRDGTHAELIAVPVEAVVPMPDNLTFEEAAASGLAYFTAYEALARADAIAVGRTVLVTGAVGAVGTAAASLAAVRGAEVIGAVRGSEQAVRAKAAGLDVVVDIERENLAEAVMRATGGAGAQAAVDTVGGGMLASVLGSLAAGGGACVLSSAPATPIGFDVLDFYRADLRLTGLNTGRLDCRRGARVLRELRPSFDAGKLRSPRVVACHPLTDAATAYSAVQAGAGGRVLIRPTD